MFQGNNANEGMHKASAKEMERAKIDYSGFAAIAETIEALELPEFQDGLESDLKDYALVNDENNRVGLMPVRLSIPAYSIPVDWYNNGYYEFTAAEHMQPAFYVIWMRCGVRMKVVSNHQFVCHDYIENLNYNCIGTGGFQYICWDGGEWEWANWNENDGTPDNSVLTSIVTDGILLTSVSADPHVGAPMPLFRATGVNTFFEEDVQTDYELEEEGSILS